MAKLSDHVTRIKNSNKARLYGRFSYVNVLEPRETPDGSELKYGLNLIMDPSHPACAKSIQVADEIIRSVCEEKWGNKGLKALGKSYHNPLRSGEDHEEDSAYAGEGTMFLNASAKQSRKPQIVDKKGEFITSDDSEDGIYSGCWGMVMLSFFPFEVTAKKGVGCGLGNVQKTRNDARLDGSTTAADDFDVIDDDEELD